VGSKALSSNVKQPTVFSFMLPNPKQFQEGVQPALSSGSQAVDTSGVTFIDPVAMQGFVFNVTQTAEFVRKAYSTSSSVRGAATFFEVSIQTNALVEGNNSIIIGGFTDLASPSDATFTVYETGHSGSLVLDNSLITNVLQLGREASATDGAYEGKRVLLQLGTPLGLKWLPAGDTEPTTGRNFEHAKLAEALRSKIDEAGRGIEEPNLLAEALRSKIYEFTKQEWDAFDLKDLRTDHFIKVDDSYFQPAAGTPDAPWWTLDIIRYRGLTRQATCSRTIPHVASADAGSATIRADYAILYSESRFLSTAWERSAGTLTLKTTLEAQFPEAPAQLRLVFEMLRPSVDQDRKMSPFVSIDGPVSILQTPLDAREYSADRGSRPPLAPAFTVKSISSDSEVLQGLATISLTLSPNAIIPACKSAPPPSPNTSGTDGGASSVCATIRIGGLLGSISSSSNAVPISGSEAWMFVKTSDASQATAVWNQTGGVMELKLAPNVPILPGQLVRIRFSLRNPASRALPNTPVVDAFATAGHSKGQEKEGMLVFAEEAMDVMDTADAFAVMRPQVPAAFTLAEFRGGSSVLGARTVITVTLRLNTQLVAPSRIVISGLRNSGTTDHPALPLSGPSALAFGGADPCDDAFDESPGACASAHACLNATNSTESSCPGRHGVAQWGSPGTANWTQETGSLVLVMRPDGKFDAEHDIVFQFNLLNPGDTKCHSEIDPGPRGICGQEIFILNMSKGLVELRVDGVLEVPPRDDDMSVGSAGYRRDAVGRAWFKSTGQVMHVQEVASVEGAIAWTSEATDTLNRLTLFLRPNFDLLPSTIIQITGLVGFASEDLPCGAHMTQGIAQEVEYSASQDSCLDWRLRLSGPDAGLFAAGATAWRRDAGTLTLQPASLSESAGSRGGQLLAGRTYVVAWTLRNGHVRTGIEPKLQQDEPFKILPQVLRTTSLTGEPCQAANGNSSAWASSGRRLMDHSDAGDADPARGRGTDSICLAIKERQKLLFSAIHSSSRKFSSLTTITVSLQFNVDLESAVEITITGLRNSRTPDDSAMPVRVMSPPSIPGSGASLFVGKDGAWDSGVWRQEAGHLILQVAAWAQVQAGHIIVFTFLLRNPAQEWLGDTPIIYASHAVNSDGYDGGGDMQIGPIVVGNRIGRVEDAFSYLQPAMLRMVPKLHPTIHDVVYTKTDVGGVLGSNLGSADYSQRARPGSTGCEVSKWASDSSIGCLVSAGVGGGPACVGSEDGSLGHCGGSLMVTIIDSLVSTTSLAFAYRAPYTSSIFPKNGPTAGGYFVKVSGLYFGTSDYSATIQLENRICETTVWVSDTVALCKVPKP